MTIPPDDRPLPEGKPGLSRHSRSLLILTGLLAVVAVATLFVGEAPDGPATDIWNRSFDLQAHRAGRGLMPENTLAAVRHALEIGVTTLELDLGLTADGIVVVLHDRRLHPDLTRGPGGDWLAEAGPAVRSLTRAELSAYEVGRLKPGSGTAKRFPEQMPVEGAPIPSLVEVFDLAEALSGETIRYNLETKIAPGDLASPAPEAIVTALLRDIAAAGVAERTAIQSFDWRSLDLVELQAPDIPTIYLTAERRWLNNLERGRPGPSPWTAGLDLDSFNGSVPAAVAQAGGQVWSPYFRDLRSGDIAEAKSHGLAVIVWTVNETADMTRLIEDGVDGIITDYPDRLRAVMMEAGMDLPPSVVANQP
ncbi:glycerophosphodiester phosphodiesterase [Algihabitans albus]|uniref:glycerophosphodiester phosphodiesterase n=1 Tax=Algihabitans albus TaxID=2164067 RepID=UPI000E5D75B1|nr:glycerophosphodiester phosphodiesterase [Algihabitans albus]